MKSLNTLKYILLALIVLGFFANFAQNSYGFLLVFFSLLGYALIFITDTIYYGIKEKPLLPVGKRRKKLKIILLFVFFVCILSPVILQFFIQNTTILQLLIASDIIICIISLIILIVLSSLNKPLFTESLSFLLFCLGFLFKWERFPGANNIIVISAVFLATHFITQSVITFNEIKKSNIVLAFWLLWFFFTISLSLLCNMFILMHWPFRNTMAPIGLILILIFIIPVLLRKKYTFENKKITLWDKIVSIKGNVMLLYIFYTIIFLWWMLTKLDITPNIYSESSPRAMNHLLAEGHTKEWNIYCENYDNFFENRQKSIKN